MTRRLLLASGGGGSFAAIGRPPVDSSWSRSGSNPMLSATPAWEETAVQEPSVLYESPTFRMWYRGGWNNEAIGYASSTDGVTWTRYAGNPVYGLGGSGEAQPVALPEVKKFDGTYWMFAVRNAFDLGGTNAAVVATSSDGLAWTTQSSSMTLPAGRTMWGNCSVWREGATWYRLQEAGPTAWATYLYTSSDGLAWTIANSGAALTTLQVHAGGMYGGPDLHTYDGVYHLWYHAAAVSGNTPTDIYHATSTDKLTWTQTPGAVLTHVGSGFEVDQVADPSVVVVGTTAYLFYDGDDNPAETALVLLATALAVF